MANNRFLGTASDVAMVMTATPGGTIEVGDEFHLTIDDTNGNSELLDVVATGTTVAQVCDDIVAAITALAATSLFKTLVTASDSTTHVTFTAATAGVPFGLTLTTTESGGGAADDQTFTRATTTARSGENDYGTPANWSTGAVPTASDVVILEHCSVDILYGLDQSTVSINGFRREASFTGKIGDGTNYLKIKADNGVIAHIGRADGGTTTPSGPQREMIDWTDSQVTVKVWGTNSTASESAKQPSRFLFNSNYAYLHTYGTSKVGVAANAGDETSVLGGIVQHGTSQVFAPEGVTVASWENHLGTQAIARCAIVAVRNSGGVMEMAGSGGSAGILLENGTFTDNDTGAKSTVTINGGMYVANGSGLIPALTIAGGGIADWSQSHVDRTVTDLTVSGDADLILGSQPTITNGIGVTFPCEITGAAS